MRNDYEQKLMKIAADKDWRKSARLFMRISRGSGDVERKLLLMALAVDLIIDYIMDLPIDV